MFRRSWRYSALAFLIGLGSLGLALSGARAMDPAAVRIGMCQTFFNDVPKVLVEVATDPFSLIMREVTGLSGQLVVGGDAFEVGKQLHDGQLQLGVFHSFEFAWVRQKYADLTPLMVAVNNQHQVRAFLLTKKDSAIACFGDLKGKELSLPCRSKEHCRLYLKQRSYEAGQCAPKDHFSQVVASANVETALDDLCTGKIEAAVVDSLGMEFYRDLKPGCFARLKVVQESELFPPAVIAYRKGAIDEDAIRRVRDGLVNANALPLGREMMKMWKVHAFEQAPADYTDSLDAILKAYPAPEPTAKVSRR